MGDADAMGAPRAVAEGESERERCLGVGRGGTGVEHKGLKVEIGGFKLGKVLARHGDAAVRNDGEIGIVAVVCEERAGDLLLDDGVERGDIGIGFRRKRPDEVDMAPLAGLLGVELDGELRGDLESVSRQLEGLELDEGSFRGDDGTGRSVPPVS